MTGMQSSIIREIVEEHGNDNAAAAEAFASEMGISLEMAKLAIELAMDRNLPDTSLVLWEK